MPVRPHTRVTLGNLESRVAEYPHDARLFQEQLRSDQDQCAKDSRHYPRNIMKACYCDENDTGDESVAVMVGIVVDSQRMKEQGTER